MKLAIELTKRTTWMIVPFYVVLMAAMSNIFFVERLKAATWIHFSTVILLTWTGVFVGINGIYSWSKVKDCVNWLKQQNDEYKSNIKALADRKAELKRNISALHVNVSKLKKNSGDLQRNLDKFKTLRDELQALCEKDDTFEHLLNEINSQCDDLQTTIDRNERAELMAIYFDISLKDEDCGKDGLSRKEYTRFLSRVNSETRMNFGRFGDFDLDDDARLALAEFKCTLDEALRKSATTDT